MKLSTVYRRVCCLTFFFLVAAASLNGFSDGTQLTPFDHDATAAQMIGGYSTGAPLDAVIRGTAARPFVYRQLLPQVANWMSKRVPERIKSRLQAKATAKISYWTKFTAPLAHDPEWFLSYWFLYALVLFSAWIAAIALFECCRAIGFSALASVSAAVTLILALPFFMTAGIYTTGFYYDFPELAFCALCIWIALKRDWRWLVPVAILATLNKETFPLFVLMLYPILRMRYSRRKAWLRIGVIGAASAAAAGYLALKFRHNLPWRDSLSGDSYRATIWNHLAAHVKFARNFFTFSYQVRTYGLPESPLLVFVMLGLICWTVWRGWKYLPRPLRLHAKIGAAINIPLFLCFCLPGEWRDLSLLYTSLLCTIAANVAEWNGDPCVASEVCNSADTA